MKVFITDKEKNIFLNKRLSLKAKGLYALLVSLLANNETINFHNMKSFSGYGNEQLRSAIKELVDSGFLSKETIRDDGGRFYWTEYLLK